MYGGSHNVENERGNVPGPLGGLRVLEIGTNIAAPLASELLALMGADVVKLERPGVGDNSRSGPPYISDGKLVFEQTVTGTGLAFLKRNRGKRGITVNLKSEGGRVVFRRLLSSVDVVVENLRPDMFEGTELNPKRWLEEHPSLVVCRVTGFGQDSGYRSRLAYDTIIQAMAGLMGHNGFADREPVKCSVSVADHVSALYAVIGILAALERRRASGCGEIVEVSMFDCVLSAVWDEPFEAYTRQGVPQRTGNRLPRAAPWNVYKAGDGWVAIGCLTQAQWAALRDIVGLPAQDRWNAPAGRIEDAGVIDAAIEAWTRVRARGAVSDFLQEAGVPCAPVLSALEAAGTPHVRERQALVEVEDCSGQRVDGVRTWELPLRFGGKRAVEVVRPAPALGGDNVEVFRDLGLDDLSIARLREEGAI